MGHEREISIGYDSETDKDMEMINTLIARHRRLEQQIQHLKILALTPDATNAATVIAMKKEIKGLLLNSKFLWAPDELLCDMTFGQICLLGSLKSLIVKEGV
ncbi:MAG: hypothetical protein Q9186_001294 [Xanthomendoza sp. 1 TL-2023]